MSGISYLRITGSPFDAGIALGQFGAGAVHTHLLKTEAWESVMRFRGSAVAATMAALVQARFPRIHAELQGLAQGLELPFEDVFLWNCRGDLWAMSPDGCTTVQLPGVPGGASPCIAHNEDGDPGFAGRCAIAECTIEGGTAFAAFVYPGSLPGHTFAVTAQGLAMTVNNLRVRRVEAGVPRMVLTRALLDTASLEAAVALLQQQPRAGGFHLTLAHRGRAELLSIEFSASSCSVCTLSSPGLHANHAIHAATRDLPQVITGSSRHRQARGDDLLAVKGPPVDPLAILGDTENGRFPIHRTAADDEDLENTLATALIEVGPAHVIWQVHEHPLQAPVFHLVDAHRETA